MKKNEYFKSLDYYSRRDAKVALAQFLLTHGWEVIGFHADKSDAMTDYYCPASWDGVAIFGEYTLVVDRRTAEAGHDIKKTNRINEPCDHCLETGEEPNGWTLEQARANPQAYWAMKKERDGEGIPLSGLISPRPFTGSHPSAVEKCRVCHGTGEKFVRTEEEVVGHYPAHLANPERKGWHLEKQGDGIVTSGQSIAKMYYGYWEGSHSAQQEAVEQACQEFLTELRIAMELEGRKAPKSLVSSVELVDYSDKAIAVFGDTKPLKDQLKAERGRFNAHLTHPSTGQKTPGWIFSKKQRPNVERLIQSL